MRAFSTTRRSADVQQRRNTDEIGGTGTSTIGISNPINFVNSGTLNAQAGTTINYASNNTFNDGTKFTGAGSNLVTTNSTFNGAPSLPTNLTLQSGNFGGTANLAGTTAWTGGTITGTLTIPNGATLNLTGVRRKTVDGGSVTNAGTVNWTGAGNLLLNNGATFTNNATFDFQSDAGIQYTTGGQPTFNNAGTLTKNAGATSVIGITNPISFVNSGTLNAAAGTINYASTNAFNGGTQFTGAGSNLVTTSSTFSGTVTSNSNLTLQSGNFSGTANLAGTTTWTGGTITGRVDDSRGATLNLVPARATRPWTAAHADQCRHDERGRARAISCSTTPPPSPTTRRSTSRAMRAFSTPPAGSPTFNTATGTLAKTGGSTTSTIGISNAINFANSGTLNAAVGTINYASANAFNAGTQFTGAGSNLVTTSSTFSGTVTSASNLTLQSGNFSGTANLAGTTTWTGGAMTGALTIPAGATLIGSGAGGKSVDGGSVTNAGTMNVVGAGNLILNNSATLANNAAFNFQSDAGIQYTSGGAPTFTNAGHADEDRGHGRAPSASATRSTLPTAARSTRRPGRSTMHRTMRSITAPSSPGPARIW